MRMIGRLQVHCSVEFLAAASTKALAVLFALCISGAVLPVDAQNSMAWGEEYARKVNASQAIDPLRDAYTGESINLYDGTTTFSTTDILIPGNSRLPVQLSRTWDLRNEGIEYLSMGDWVIDAPNIDGTFLASIGWPDQRCTAATAPSGTIYTGGVNQYAVIRADEYWNGYHLNLPGAQASVLMKKADYSKVQVPEPSLGANSPWMTRDGWHFSCLPGLQRGSGEGFVAFAPDGTKYTFDWMVTDLYRGITRRGSAPGYLFLISRKKIKIYATKVEDRFGNWVRYEWSESRLQRIHANDGREITLSYNADGRLSTASAAGRTWNYQYTTFNAVVQSNTHYLSAVTLPDGGQWKYDASAFVRSIVYKRASYYDTSKDADGYLLQSSNYCNLDRVIVSGGGVYAVTTPSGARVEYVLSSMRHGRKNVTEDCMDAGENARGANSTPLHYDVLSLAKKTISGAGVVSRVDLYQYSGMDTGYAVTGDAFGDRIRNATPTPNYKTVTVTRSDGIESVSVFGRDFRLNEGRLLRSELRQGSVVRNAVVNEFIPINQISAQNFPNYAGLTDQSVDGVHPLTQWPVYKTTIFQDGVWYSSQVPLCDGVVYCFDAFARPTKIVTSNSLGFAKTDAIEYQDDLDNWILGQVKREYNVETGVIASEASYNTLAQPVWTKRFGKLQQTLTYNADGTLATAADGRGNVTTFSNWKRGIPQLIRHPATPEAPAGATESAIVNDNGWITAVTDENGYATGYGYDAMGRLASIVYPSGADETYHNTLMNFRALSDADWKPPGVASGQWRLYEETGSRATITYMDALWRPVLKHEYDAANVGPTLRAVKTGYDSSGRVSFQSYPSSDMIPGASGIRTFYDALDRVTRVEQDSELGVLATTTEYLAGLKTRVTNPRGFQTTTSFMAWDQPGYDLPILSEQPEGKVVEIARHPQFGWPTQLKQRNAAGTLQQSRQYVYDVYGQLCKTIEPETGATVMDYDAAGNLSWSAAGLTGATYAGLTDCSQAAAGGSGRVAHRAYDARNRLTNLAFPDGRGNQVWTYKPDGLPANVTVYNDGNGLTPVVTAYEYNRRRLLTGESLSQPGWYTWGLGYAYDAYGSLRTQLYPTGLVVDYAPNPLGQATQVRDNNNKIYASGAQYYPNGALKQFTYGNGIVHTMTQNARQLPSRSTSSGGASDLGYFYDANANVSHIADHGRGDSFSRWMQYDTLDRLTAAGSASFGGDHWHRFAYDALDNMTSWKLAGVKDYADYVYNAQNQLTNIRNTAGATVVGMGYGPQGNLQNKNGQTYDFDYGNRLRSAIGKEYYRYDGLGRRVMAWEPATNSIFSQYSQSGQVVYQENYRGPQTVASEHLYLGGSLIASRESTWGGSLAIKYQHTDALGSPVAVSNEAGQVIERNDYEPYGAIIGKPTFSGIGYTGHVMDGATSLTYMQQRYYDQSIGRFLSVDPVVTDSNSGASFNRYEYAANSPYRFIDPDGRQHYDMGEAAAELGTHVGIALDSNQYSRMPNSPEKARLARNLAIRVDLFQNDPQRAQRFRLEADTIEGAPAGIVYRRINPRTGETYIGQAQSPEHYSRRQNSHDRKLRTTHEYEVLGRATPGQSLSEMEESQIRLHGGLKHKREDGGGVVNRRYQMNDTRYRAAGGRVPLPISTRIRTRR
jgi:RHS repeat-associated protein